MLGVLGLVAASLICQRLRNRAVLSFFLRADKAVQVEQRQCNYLTCRRSLVPSAQSLITSTSGPLPLLLLAPPVQGDVSMHVHDERGLLALQGPEAAAVLQKHVAADLGTFYFGQFMKAEVAGAPCFVTRTGWALAHAAHASWLSFSLPLSLRFSLLLLAFPCPLCLPLPLGSFLERSAQPILNAAHSYTCRPLLKAACTEEQRC